MASAYQSLEAPGNAAASVSAEEGTWGRDIGESFVTRREWSGGLWQCCGTGSGAEWQICCASTWCLPFAFAHNMRRALNLNARRELWIFFIFGYWFLTFSFLRLVVSLSATQHCGKDPALDADPSDASYSTDFSKQAYASALRQYTTCQNGYIAVRILFILVNLACLAYAGHRRVQMRRRYGLPGNDVRDYALWIAFPWCALAQESRTLSHNRVLGGVWRGPAAPFVPPPVQAMSHEAPRAPAPQPAPPSPGEGAAPTRAGALREHAAAAEEAPPPAAAGGYVPPNLDFE